MNERLRAAAAMEAAAILSSSLAEGQRLADAAAVLRNGAHRRPGDRAKLHFFRN